VDKAQKEAEKALAKQQKEEAKKQKKVCIVHAIHLTV
jgi:hypothetical protein